jgi:hypothetical protein
MPACETVLFRHWDPNVLGGLLPLLDGPQQARFLGAATGLALDATDLGRLMAAPRPTGLPAAAPGMLQFSEGQLEAFVERRDDDFHRKIMLYLRDAAPEYLGRVPELVEIRGRRNLRVIDDHPTGGWHRHRRSRHGPDYRHRHDGATCM